MRSMEEVVRYGGDILSMRTRVCGTDHLHHPYGRGIPSVRTSVSSMDLSHLRYGRWRAVQDYQSCSGGCLWLYFSGTEIFYRQWHCNLDFIILLLYADLDEVLSVCLYYIFDSLIILV